MATWFWKIGAKAKKLRDKILHESPYSRAFGCIVFGAAIYLLFPDSAELWKAIATILISLGFVQILFEMEFKKNLEKNLSDLQTSTKKLHKDVGDIDTNVGKLDTNVGKLDGDLSELEKATKVAKGAIESGLAAIYATRQKCLEEIKKTLEEVLESIKQGTRKGEVEVSLLGISLGDFLTPHGELWHTFQKVLSSEKFKIKLAILEDGCKAACCRARVEEESTYESWDKGRRKCWDCKDEEQPCLDLYQDATCHSDLMTATGSLQKLDRGRPIEPDGWEPTYVMKAKLEAYTYKILPMVFMFQMDDHMFVEQYHLGSRGGQTPILHIHRHRNEQDNNESQLFRIFMNHFDSVIAMSRRV